LLQRGRFAFFLSELSRSRRSAGTRAREKRKVSAQSIIAHFATALSCWQGILQYNFEKEGIAMKSFLVYSSQTGNTRKLAQAAYHSLSGQKEIHKIEDAPVPDGFERSALCGSCC
jgi:hypothetical protein